MSQSEYDSDLDEFVGAEHLASTSPQDTGHKVDPTQESDETEKPQDIGHKVDPTQEPDEAEKHQDIENKDDPTQESDEAERPDSPPEEPKSFETIAYWKDVSPSQKEDILPEIPLTRNIKLKSFDYHNSPLKQLSQIFKVFTQQVDTLTLFGFQKRALKGLATIKGFPYAIYWNITNEADLIWPTLQKYLDQDRKDLPKFKTPPPRSYPTHLDPRQPPPVETIVRANQKASGLRLHYWMYMMLRLTEYDHLNGKKVRLEPPRYNGKLRLSHGKVEFNYRLLRLDDTIHPISEIFDLRLVPDEVMTPELLKMYPELLNSELQIHGVDRLISHTLNYQL